MAPPHAQFFPTGDGKIETARGGDSISEVKLHFERLKMGPGHGGSDEERVRF